MGKYDNPMGHDWLWERHFAVGDYINYPRGRVIYDSENNRAIIYIDTCIHTQKVIDKIKRAFEIDIEFDVLYDPHYRCKRCMTDLWEEI